MRIALVYSLLMLTSVADAQQERSGLEVNECQIITIKDPTLYATKPGRLTAAPEEGDVVSVGSVVAKIDDKEALLSLRAAMIEEAIAKKQAENDVDIRYAEAQEKVTEAEYQEALDTNKRAPGTISESETRRRKFQHKRSGLATEQARRDHVIAVENVKLATAKVQVAEHEWKTRRVTSEIAGVVSERYAQVGEWVNAGDPIAKLMQLDRVRVLGWVNAAGIARNEVIGKDVVVEITLGGGKPPRRIPARLNHAGFQVTADATFKVWADIPNIQEDGQFLIQPGCDATMHIDVNGLARRDSLVPAPGL